MSNLDALRDALTDIGRGDLVARELLDTMLFVETGGERRSRVALVQQHDGRAWTIYGRATTKGGWAVHADGASIAEAVQALVALGPDVLDPPTDPMSDLPGRVLRALAEVGATGTREVLGDDAVFRWTTVFAADDMKALHRSFRAAVAVLTKELGPPREVSRRRRGGPKLAGAIWGTTALFESDHDPGAGELLQLAVWERGVPGELPPWG